MATWFDKLLKRNTGKEAISQYWNPTGGDGTGDYEAVEGSSGAPKMQADDGKIASIGAKADVAATSSVGSFSVIALLKSLVGGITIKGSSIPYGQPVPVGVLNNAGNGVDALRGNTEGTLLASAARTTTATFPNQTNYNARGVIIFLNVTATPGGTETLQITFMPRDGTAGTTANWWATFTIPANTTGTFALLVYPGASTTPETSTKNKAYSSAVPRSWVGAIVPSGSGSWTYSVDCSYIV